MDKPNCKLRLSKSLDCLVVLFILVLAAANLKMVFIALEDLEAFPPADGNYLGEGVRLLLPVLISSLAVVLLCLTRYECFGAVRIYDDRIELRSFLRQKRVLLFSNIHFLGIGYAVINHSRQFWIYFSTDRIPGEYLQRMNRLRISGSTIKLQFDPKVFDALLHHLPKDLSKQLRASYSIIRLNK